MATKHESGSDFYEFFIDELKDIYWAEKHLEESLPKLADAATSEEVKDAFMKHARETEQHISMVEQVFRYMGEEPETKKCEAMEGLLKEAKTIISDTEKDSFTRDAGLILAAQKVEHYEIATYGTLRIFAGYMDQEEVVDVLTQILDNEKYTDVSLTKVTESFVNVKAAVE
ncbi:MAG: ferritin-like domain-containing protein [Rikenellaceae bacterium]|nr:ferritin-like domain-containing protein [Rikenellaceae bacterium]